MQEGGEREIQNKFIIANYEGKQKIFERKGEQVNSKANRKLIRQSEKKIWLATNLI